jgi:hypothetical protein
MHIAGMSKEMPSFSSSSSFIHQLCIGALSGLATTVMIEPLSYMKNSRQQKLPLVADIRAIYRGLFINIAGFVPAMALRSSVYTYAMAHLQRSDLPTSLANASAAAAAGVVSAIPSTFRELMLVQQTQPQGGPIPSSRDIIRMHGPRAFFTGLPLVAGRNSSFAGFFFIVTPALQGAMEQCTQNSVALKFGPGLLAGAMSAIVTHPIDTVRSHVQRRLQERTKLAQAARDIYYDTATEPSVRSIGISNFFRGIVPRIIAVAVTMSMEYNFRAFFTKYF